MAHGGLRMLERNAQTSHRFGESWKHCTQQSTALAAVMPKTCHGEIDGLSTPAQLMLVRNSLGSQIDGDSVACVPLKRRRDVGNK